ncbi:copper homeostasis protein (lipoprotein) [Parelusimicrobium proximum]|uniref:copper resistance protein NlpE n=1 Tax=Parelusimicrobium proximum TaxID=3228953 RepID=UPI003D180270
MKKVLLLVLAVAFAAACGYTGPKSADDLKANYLGEYKGVIPCADCEGIDMEIMLNPSTYSLTRQYLGKNDATYYGVTSTWSYDEKTKVLTLNEMNGEKSYWKFSAKDSLTMLDQEGKVIESGLNYTLIKQ